MLSGPSVGDCASTRVILMNGLAANMVLSALDQACEGDEGFDFVRWLWWGSPFDGMIPMLELEHGRLHCNGALLPDVGWADCRDSAWEGDCYFAACSVANTWQARTARGAWRKPSTGEAVAIPALWLDLDPVGPARVPVDHVLRELDKHGLQSLAVVDSGRGVQLWQPLQRPLRCEPTGAACKTLLRRHGEWIAARLPLAELGAKADSSVWEQSRIMRLPGTRNGKTGELARVVRLGEHLPWEQVSKRVLAPKPIEREASSRSARGDRARHTTLAIEALDRKHVPGERDVNPDVYNLARALGGHGAPLDAFLAAVERHSAPECIEHNKDTARRAYEDGQKAPINGG